jgi:Cu2+-exporting ATPase
MAEGKTVVFVAYAGRCLGLIAASDTIRPSSFVASRELKKLGIMRAIITGDNERSAESVAKQLDIGMVYAQVLPQEKAAKIQQLRMQGYKVAMVGDGINDAPALAAADVGIAIGAGTDVARETADIILVHNDPTHVVELMRLSRLFRKKITQNVFLAVSYNIVALPVAAGLFEPLGITLSPALGAIAMSLSTIIVAINARLLPS